MKKILLDTSASDVSSKGHKSKKILLVEPDYYTRYPPLGLLKLSSYHKAKGDEVLPLVRGRKFPKERPDMIYVTSLFSWAWPPVWDAVRYYKIQFPDVPVHLGGIYATLVPVHAARSGADKIVEGVVSEIDQVRPDYSQVPEWDATLLFGSRGCPRKCGFCAVPKLEGAPFGLRYSIEDQLYPGHKRIVFFDNNILAVPNWSALFDELIRLDKIVDFNQGMDARCMSEDAARKISNMRFQVIRMAWDYYGIKTYVTRAVEQLGKFGVNPRKITFYVLYNYQDDPQDFFLRIKHLLNLGVVCYPMRFEPLCTLEKGRYVGPKWTKQELQTVQLARRVIGYAGAFPPYEALVNKFNQSNSFAEAFDLKRRTVYEGQRSEPLEEMAAEHQMPVARIKNYFPKWRKEPDWRRTRGK